MLLRNVVIVLLLMVMGVSATAARTYAILGHESETEKASENPVTKMITTRLKARAMGRIIEYAPAVRILTQRGCKPSAYTSGNKYSMAAGRILNANYLVYGKTTKSNNQITIESYLIETANGRPLGHTLVRCKQGNATSLLKAVDTTVVQLLLQRHKQEARKQKKTTSATSSAFASSVSYTQDLWATETRKQITDHLEFGIRIDHFKLINDSERHFDSSGSLSEGYLGSITDLREDQNYAPTLYANILFSDWLALNIGYERYTIETVTYWDGHSDGAFDFSGPSFSAQFRYPNRGEFTPYAGLGFVMLDAEFTEEGWWHNGFGGTDAAANYQAWISSGAPAWPNGGYRRNLEIHDDLVFKLALQGGCHWQAMDYVSVNLGLRYVNLDSKLDYTLSRYGTVFSDRGTSKFPMEVWTVDLGVVFNF
jgi:hypothetical protein